ncbi:MAG: tRNA (adenosine(37)-N6)-dimethylallyltransferase MiaA [Bacteroidia bacterium]|nr:tRNA (adenosine(37)-N6)-dimethylallyltransferase MiaA [Bacteroidia bacterium]MDW8133629.1 tRNA (adenosine(37)-N6)-dimethylallyltransferase MiaA [Bacteroidia bacterium]
MKNRPFLLCIGGPTGSGKTELAITLYHKYGWPIISADSRQVYRYLDIGTNKVSQAIQAEVPHFLVDIRYPDEIFSAGKFVQEVEALLSRWNETSIVQVVGGTGFYIHALLYGLDEIPSVPMELRQDIEHWRQAEGIGALVRWLEVHDPLTASRIDLRNPHRVQRAIEILKHTGRPWVSFWGKAQKTCRYPAYVVVLSPPRDKLYQAIATRTYKQVLSGWLEETVFVLAKGYSPAVPGLQTLGYKECLKVLRGESSHKTLYENITRANRDYARRQLTWWRHHPPDSWIEEFPSETLCVRVAKEVLRRVEDAPR